MIKPTRVNPKSILVIDNDENVRQSLVMVLQRCGFCVSPARYAWEALDLLRNVHFDLIFLDIQLPDMDGISLLSKIQELYPKLPVMILTAYPGKVMLAESESLQTVGYLLKPIDTDLLIDQIKRLLENENVNPRP